MNEMGAVIPINREPLMKKAGLNRLFVLQEIDRENND